MTSPQVARMGFVSREDQNRACRDIILRQYRSTPKEMGRGREALMNGIEACHRAAILRSKLGIKGAYKPEVYLGAHPAFPNLFCIADNGVGMTYDEAVRHLASIGNSGNSVVSKEGKELFLFDGNKGVGVKISLLPDNPGGLDYVSAPLTAEGTPDVWWFKLGMDAENFPGFIQLGEEDGYNDEEASTAVQLDWQEQQDSLLNFKHIQSAKHGTVLTLFGSDRGGNENTADNGSTFLVRTAQRTNKPDNDYSLLSYINKRFWEFDVKVTVNLGKECRQALGATHFLKRSKDKGQATLQMTDGEPVTVHWWILRLNQGGNDGQQRHLKSWARSGHVAFKYKGELYWDTTAPYNAHKKDLRSFGVYAGHDAVAIYIDLDTLSDKAKAKLFSNESRTRLFYDQEELLAVNTYLGAQFDELLRANDPSVAALADYINGELQPQESDKQSDDALKRLLKSLSLFTPLEKQIKAAASGPSIAAEDTERKEGKTGNRNDNPSKARSAKAPFTPKGSVKSGVEDWVNELPRFTWSDEINPTQSVSYVRNSVECFSQCSRFQYLLDSTIRRVSKDVDGVPDGVIRETCERRLKEAVKAQILSYIYVTAGFAKAQKTSFFQLQHEACDEPILEAQLMLNAATQERLTKTVLKELSNVQ
jgi:hypothetical protein